MDIKNYDLIIIGAGPSGLSLAHYMRDSYKKILIIESESSIGGAHRVERVRFQNEFLFTEHSPRIYVGNYISFIKILDEINYNFYDNFTPYNYNILNIVTDTILPIFTFKEFITFFLEFNKLLFDSENGSNYNLKKFLDDNSFSPESIDIIDRICRLSDGAGIDKITLNELFQIFNQNFFYKIYEPKIPNDIGLFKNWNDFLLKSGVEIKTNTKIKNIILDNDNKNIKSIIISENNIDKEIFCSKLVIATPPRNIIEILDLTNNPYVKNCFGDFDKLKSYASNTEYNTYISITFHWNRKINLDKVYGFPLSEWGIIFINMTDYMEFNEKNSKTVLSTSISITDRKSSFTNKTANESTKEELINEVLRQLKLYIKNLENPTTSIVYPGIYYDSKLKQWRSYISGFISTSKDGFLDFESKNINGIYNVGIHNGFQSTRYTVLESAVCSSIKLSHILDPSLKNKYEIDKPFDLISFIKIIIFIFIMSIIIYICQTKKF
jgi:uncharacterized protein with NAD-binding domain and iron-sulfur cluster